MAKERQEAKQSAPDLTVNFVGRFAFLFDKNKREVRVVAPKMNDPDIRFLPHTVSLALPSLVVASGGEHASRSIALPWIPLPGAPALKQQPALAEWLVWDLAGYDVEFVGYQVSAVDSQLPSDPGGPTPLVVPAIDGPVDPGVYQYNLPVNKKVSSRVNLIGGKLTGHYESFGIPPQTKTHGGEGLPEDPSDFYMMKSANEHGPVTSDSAGMQLADVVRWETSLGATVQDPFKIRLRAFDGCSARTIVLRDASPITFNISNVCVAGLQINRDHEFAAYYELMDQPTIWKERIVPTKVNAPAQGNNRCDGSDHCSGFAQFEI